MELVGMVGTSSKNGSDIPGYIDAGWLARESGGTAHFHVTLHKDSHHQNHSTEHHERRPGECPHLLHDLIYLHSTQCSDAA